MKVENCPVCGANSFKEVMKAPYFRGDNELFAIQQCEACDLWFTNPRPNDEDLGEYYNTENYISHSNKKEGMMDKVYQVVRSYSLKKKVSLINRVNGAKGKLLDFGSGTGHFANEAKNNGWDVTGVEPSEDARKVAKETFKLELNEPDSFKWKEGSYDIISLWHVLEHVTDLSGHLSNFSNSLKPEGALIIAVPNHESYDSKKYGHRWAALDVPLHLYHFKKKNIEHLAELNGLVLEEVQNMPFDSYYVSLLSEKILSNNSNPLRAIWRGFLSNMKGKGSKNQSSLIYILRKPK